MKNKYSIIISTYNREKILKENLANLLIELRECEIEIIIINDFKNKDLDDYFYQLKNNIKIYNNPKSGVASARNFGASKAKNEWLIFLDDDMIFSKDNLVSFNKYIFNNDKICVNIEWDYPTKLKNKINNSSFGRYLEEKGFTSMRGWNNYPNWKEKSSNKVDSVSSANLLINKKRFFEIKGYSEEFPFAGFEDYVFSNKLKLNNFTMIVDTTSIMYHNEEDRTILIEWLKRKERDAFTRKIAVKHGYHEKEIKYTLIKKTIYSNNKFYLPLIFFILNSISERKILDRISFMLIDFLLGTFIYKGYMKQ